MTDEKTNQELNGDTPEKKEPDDDFYFDPGDFVTLTEEYLLKRGYCCGSGCVNCPYDYKRVPEPHRSVLLEKRRRKDKDNTN